MSFTVQVDVQNPGQVFACGGLFELAYRLDGDARARFDADRFTVDAPCSLPQLLDALLSAPLTALDPADETASPLHLGGRFDLRLDWWKDELAGGRDLKVWAGSMRSTRIAQAMIAALRDPAFHTAGLFDVGCVVFDPDDATSKIEPFYFDARRAPNAHSRDVGFAPNTLELTTTAFPAVEALCLIGLQRFRPARTARRRVFDYWIWTRPLALAIAPAVFAGAAPLDGTRSYRFESWFRTGQRKHKAFRSAVPTQGNPHA